MVDDQEFIVKPKGGYYPPLWPSQCRVYGGILWLEARDKARIYSGSLVASRLPSTPPPFYFHKHWQFWHKVCNLSPLSSHHLESLPHQVDNPVSICNSSSQGIFFFWVHCHSISTTQCLVYTLDLVPTSDGISYFLHSVLTYLSCCCMKTHSSNSINSPRFNPCLFLFPTPPTSVTKALPNPQIHLLSTCKAQRTSTPSSSFRETWTQTLAFVALGKLLCRPLFTCKLGPAPSKHSVEKLLSLETADWMR